MLTYHKTTEEEKERITAWQYTGEYAIYNTAPYAEQKARGVGFANPKNNFYSFLEDGALVGFINLYEEPTEVFFGIGVRPEPVRQRLWLADDAGSVRAVGEALSGEISLFGGQNVERESRSVL